MRTQPAQDRDPAPAGPERPAGPARDGDAEDDLLMARVAVGDETALRRLVERWEQPLFGFLYQMTGSVEDALDLRQETFLRVYAAAARYRGEGRFRSWLLRIAGNLARGLLRRRRIVRWIRFDPLAHDAPAATPPPDAGVEGEEAARRVREAIARLPVRQREALTLKRFQGLSYREIAEAMGATEAAVESLLIRATAAIRLHLDQGEARR